MTFRKSIGQGGTGPGPITPDGSAADAYATAVAHGEDGLIDSWIPPNSSILELGCGTGRITHPLIARGHQVLAVDESPDMLARVTGTETLCARIEDLRLERRFDVVLFMSYLVNVPDDEIRRRMLDTCAQHVTAAGSVLIQRHDRRAFAAPSVHETEHGRQVVSDVRQLPGDRQSATMTLQIGDQEWSQQLVVQNFSEDGLAACLRASGLSIAEYLTPDKGWLRARLL
jgi:SAM-dependent methyltransferase